MFLDRTEAGQKLAKALLKYKDQDVVVLGLPRGGVPVAYQIAKEFNAKLDVIVVRKIGAPLNPEFGVGAIAEGVEILDQESLHYLGLKPEDLRDIINREKKELERRTKLYRGDSSFPDLCGRIVILVDDGIATGVSTRAAIKAVRQMNPGKIVLAVPVAPPEPVAAMRFLVDDLVCLQTPSYFMAVGAFYQSFPQTSDEEVIELLKKNRGS